MSITALNIMTRATPTTAQNEKL